MKDRALRVCYFGTYRAGYSRNQIMIESLRRAGVDVVECHEPLWRGIDDRVQAASGGWLRPAFLARVVRTYWRLIGAYRTVGDYDVMVLGYPGVLDAYLARILTWLRSRPLVLDLFMSLYLIAIERGLATRHPISGRLTYWLEKLACRLPDLLLKDTAEYVKWCQEVFGLDADRFRLVPTGADDRVFQPQAMEGLDDGTCIALYYGTFIPNHGVKTIVEAARILRDEPGLCFELIGDGPTRAQAMASVEEHGLENVAFVDWVEKRDLPHKVAQADLCLGAFGTTPQSMMTVHNKIYEGLAMRKCVITGDSPAMRSTLTHGEHLWLCERADSDSLAQAILTLKRDPVLRESLADKGHQCFLDRFTIAALGEGFRGYLQELVRNS
jgi:glycosyltransferase involved in cell wall biosynthesis